MKTCGYCEEEIDERERYRVYGFIPYAYVHEECDKKPRESFFHPWRWDEINGERIYYEQISAVG